MVLLSDFGVFGTQQLIFGRTATDIIEFTERLPFTVPQDDTSTIIKKLDLICADRRRRRSDAERILIIGVDHIARADRIVLIFDLRPGSSFSVRLGRRLVWKSEE